MEQNFTSSNIHGSNTRNGSDFHQTISNLSLYQRGSYRMGLKVFNSLPTCIKDTSYNVKEFKCLLKNFSLFEFFLYIAGVFQIQKYIIYLFIAFILFILLDQIIFKV